MTIARSSPARVPVVLLIEADTVARIYMRRIVSALGYHVLAAEDGPAAIATATSFSARIDVAVVDLKVALDTSELVRQLNDIQPGLKTLFLSCAVPDDAQAVPPEGAACIDKFSSPAEIEHRIRELLV